MFVVPDCLPVCQVVVLGLLFHDVLEVWVVLYCICELAWEAVLVAGLLCVDVVEMIGCHDALFADVASERHVECLLLSCDADECECVW